MQYDEIISRLITLWLPTNVLLLDISACHKQCLKHCWSCDHFIRQLYSPHNKPLSAIQLPGDTLFTDTTKETHNYKGTPPGDTLLTAAHCHHLEDSQLKRCTFWRNFTHSTSLSLPKRLSYKCALSEYTSLTVSHCHYLGYSVTEMHPLETLYSLSLQRSFTVTNMHLETLYSLYLTVTA